MSDFGTFHTEALNLLGAKTVEEAAKKASAALMAASAIMKAQARRSRSWNARWTNSRKGRSRSTAATSKH